MQRQPQASAPGKKMFGRLSKPKNLFSNVEFHPSASMKKRNSQPPNAGLLSESFSVEDDDFHDDESGSVASGMSRFSRSSMASKGLRILGRKREPKHGSPKRTSSQAVPGKTRNNAGFGSIQEVVQNMQQDEDDKSLASVDPFGSNERTVSSQNSSTWEHVIHLSPDKSNATMSPKKKEPQRPSLLLGSSYQANNQSEQSLDFFGVVPASPEKNRTKKSSTSHSSNDKKKKGKNKNRNPHDSFDVIEPTVSKRNKQPGRGVPKGANKKTSRKHGTSDDDLNKRARELEEIGNIGSSSEALDYNPDEDDDGEEDRGFGNAPQFGDEEEEFDFFEDAEASSYYSGTSGREHDDGIDYEYCDAEYGSPRAGKSSSAKRNAAPLSSSNHSLPKNRKPEPPPIRTFERLLPPNHFAGFVDHGDWRALGKDANKIRKRPGKKFVNQDSESDTDSDSSSSSCESRTHNRASSFHHSFSQEPLDLSSDDDDDSITAAPEKEEEVEKKPAARRNLTRMSSFQLRQWDGFRNQVEKLVQEAMPENVLLVDKMMEQFAGREAELVQTLEKMTVRTVGRRTNRVHRSRQMTGTRRTQNWQTSEAVAHIAAACTIDEGVNIDDEYWKEDVSVYSNEYLMGKRDDNSDSGGMSQIDESEGSSYYSETYGSQSDSESVYTDDDDDQSYYDDDQSYDDDDQSYDDDGDDGDEEEESENDWFGGR